MHVPYLARLQVLVDPADGLITQADMRGDVLVGQAVQALVAASSGAVPAARTAATLLRAMQPSSKVLSALGAQLQAGPAGGSTAGPSKRVLRTTCLLLLVAGSRRVRKQSLVAA